VVEADGEFPAALLRKLGECWSNRCQGNHDALRFPPLGLIERVRRLLLPLASLLHGRSVVHSNPESPNILTRVDELERTHALLEDSRSRGLFIELLAFRAMGPERVKLSRNTEGYWDLASRAAESLVTSFRTHRVGYPLRYLNYYDLESIGVPVRLYGHPLNILDVFLLQQYRYSHDGTVIEVEEGDVVVDGGACWGDATLYFASRVGERGRIYAFEYEPGNKTILEENLHLNPALARTVRVESTALWHTAGLQLSYTTGGPGSRVEPKNCVGGRGVPSMTIDHLVEEEGLDRVDFIKLDVEGAELNALRGADETLRRWRPQLAISVYHRDDDLITIPLHVESLGLNYEFYLDHFTIHSEETVLFARSRHRKECTDEARGSLSFHDTSSEPGRHRGSSK